MTRFRKKSVQTLIAAIVTALLCLGFIRLAEAQSLNSTLGSPFLETLHHVSISRNNDIAYLDVQRAFKNEGIRRDEMVLKLNLPSDTSMTSISIYENGWKPALLKESSRAQTQYYQTNTAPLGKNAHNLLAEGSWEDCTIRVSPVSPGETVLIRYTLTIEMEYKAGYSFRWNSSPKSTEHFSAIQFRSSDMIWAKGMQRSANEVFYLHANACEENDRAASCQIRKFDLPETTEERFRFSADITGVEPYNFDYVLRSPEGEFFSMEVKDDKVEGEFPSISGNWFFSIGADVGKHPKIVVKNIRLDFDKISLHTEDIEFTSGSHELDRIYFSNSQETKGKMYFGSFSVENRQFSKIDLILPEHLSQLPKNPTMIFLIDRSISQTRLGLKRQIALVNSITSHTEDEEAILIAYDRHAKQIPISSGTLDETLHNLEGDLPLANGSDLGKAIELAVTLSSKANKKRPVLIYAMTDLLLKSSQTVSKLLKKVSTLGENATFHVVEISKYEDVETRIRRDDTIFLSALARPSGGISALASFEGDGIDKTSLFEQTLYLVRPTILEHSTLGGFYVEESYPEGAFVSTAGWNTISGRAEIAGQLWSRPFSMSTSRSKDRELITMRYFINSESFENAKQAYEISKKSQIVSPYTSFVIDGADRIEDGFSGVGGFGLHGTGSVGCGGVFLGRTLVAKPDLGSKFDFKSLAEKCNATHPGKGNTFRTIMETTSDEIVDVGEGKNAYEKCVVKGVWDTRLPKETRSASYRLHFIGANVHQ